MDEISKDFPVLESERLRFIEMKREHKADIFRLFSDKAVVEHYDLEQFKSRTEAVKLITWFARQRRKNLGIRWGIVERNSEEIIGTIGFYNFSPNHRSTIGYALRSDKWGQGIMQEAVETIIRFGFEQLQVNRIEAEVMKGNLRSERLLEKIGFNKEGVLKSWMQWKDRHFDISMFALLRSEWMNVQDVNNEDRVSEI
jgi:[ribosomal protein S5]-alanine N-acetyltransferase